jgi:hypothetical protein
LVGQTEPESPYSNLERDQQQTGHGLAHQAVQVYLEALNQISINEDPVGVIPYLLDPREPNALNSLLGLGHGGW